MENVVVFLRFGYAEFSGYVHFFFFFDFELRYPFWVRLVRKVKIVSLFQNLVPGLMQICRIQWRCSVFLLLY